MLARFTRGLLIVLTIYCSFKTADASHIVGGEINYTCVSDYTFRFKVSLYMEPTGLNAANSLVDASVMMNIYNTQDPEGFDSLFSVDRSSIDTIYTFYISACSNDELSDSVYKWNFEFEYTFEPNDSGYTVGYWRCCRPLNITNVEDNMGLALTIDIPDSTILNSACNSSPTFDAFPPKFVCATDNFNIFSSATDADGDSLVYSLCAPKNGGTTLLTNQDEDEDPDLLPPFQSILYRDGYSAINPFGDSQIEINPNTGVITGTSANQGRYVVGICVEEYRNGVLLSKSFRDIPIEIVVCDGLLNSSFEIADTNDLGYSCGTLVEFANATAGSESFVWDFGFSDSTDDQSIEKTPIVQFPDTGMYQIRMVAENADFSGCFDTTIQNVYIGYGIQLDFLNIQECDSSDVLFSNQSVFDSVLEPIQWQWSLTDIDIIEDTNATFTFPSIGNYELVFSAVDQWNCAYDSATAFTFVPRPIANFNIVGDSSKACQTDVTFTNTSLGAHQFQWIFGDISDTSLEVSPAHEYTTTGDYLVELIAGDSACSDTLERMITVFNGVTSQFISVTQCDTGLVTFLNQSIGATVDSILWTFDEGDNSTLDTAYYEYSSGATEEVTLRVVDENGCISSSTQIINVNYVQSDFDIALNTNGAVSLTKSCDLAVDFSNYSIGANSYLWTYEPGVTDADADGYYAFPSSGAYTVSLAASNDDCSDTISKLIEVVNGPQAMFAINGFCDSTFFQDLSQTREVLSERTWTFGDGTSSNASSLTYKYDAGGTYQVNLHLEDIYGCTSDSSVVIEVFMPADTNFVLYNTEDSAVSCGLIAVFTNPAFDNSNDSRITYVFEGGSFGELVTNDENVAHEFVNYGTYTVLYRVAYLDNTNETVCEYEHSQTIRIVKPSESDFTFEADCDTTLWSAEIIDSSNIRTTSWLANGETVGNGNQFYYTNMSRDTELSFGLSAVDNNGCVIDSIITVDYKPIPVTGFELSYNGENPLAGKSVDFIENTLHVDSICWIIDGDSIIISEGDGAFIFKQAGTYTVEQLLKNGTCDKSLTQTIEIEHNLLMEAPEIFTPDGNASNSNFTVVVAGLEDFNIQIYNRWGKLVYEQTNIDKVEWDGRSMKDKELPTGTYVYFITGIEVGGDMQEKSGEIYLLR